MIDEIKNAKDKVVGKAAEAAGKITNDQKLEFSGKFQTLTSDISSKVNTIENDALEEVNDFMDKVNANQKDKQ